MRGLLFKYVPIAAALGLVALLFVVEPGPMRWLVITGLVVFVVLLWIASIIAKTLPAQPTMTPATDEIGTELAEICEGLKKLGFEQVGTPVHVNVVPQALLVGFVHAREPIYATAFVAGERKITSFDMVSVLEDDRGGLTSSPKLQASTMPAERGSFRQIQPDGSLEAIYAMHADGLAYLREHGLQTRPVSAGIFVSDITTFLQRQRAAFLRAPFLYAAIALKRSIVQTQKYARPVREQGGTRRDIEWLASAKASLPRASARFR